MSVRDKLPAVGGGGMTALVVDMALTGGDLALYLIDWIAATANLWVPFFSIVANRIAPTVDWIPEGTVNTLLLIAASVMALVYLWRIYKRTND